MRTKEEFKNKRKEIKVRNEIFFLNFCSISQHFTDNLCFSDTIFFSSSSYFIFSEQHDAKTKALQITRKAQVEELENKKNAVYTRERQVLTDREESKKQKNLAKASYSLAKQKESQAQNFLEDSCALFAEKEAEKEEQSRVHDEHLQQLQEQKQQVQEQKQSVQQKLVERQIDLVKSGSIVWKCDIGNNDLREYDTNIAILLERSYENKNTVEFTRGSHDYFIDWKRFSQGAQVNKSTNVARKLTRHLFTAADVKIAVNCVETKLCEERKQRTSKREQEQKSMKEAYLKDKAETALEHVVWKCFANNRWTSYNDRICMLLEISHQSGFTTTKFNFRHATSSSNFSYRVETNSEGTFVQVNEKTNVERDVRRERVVDDGIMWGVEAEKINSNCYKYVCESKRDGADTLENRHYNIASKQFEQFIQGKIVTKVEFWDNRILKKRFTKKRRQLIANGFKKKNLVFHGTPSADNIPLIMTSGFRVGGQNGHAITNGAVHGQGVYTAVGVNTGIRFGQGVKQLILCEALVGNCVGTDASDGGDSWKPHGDWQVYKTSEQVLPKYVVHFKDKD